MDVVSACPLRVGSVLWEARPGLWMLTVCKATYTLLPEESPLADEQDDPTDADTHWDDDKTPLGAATGTPGLRHGPQLQGRKVFYQVRRKHL